MKQASAVIEGRGAAALRARSMAAVAVLMVTAVVSAGCSPEAETKPSPASRSNFVLIVIDTLRADRLGFAGHRENDLPAFDRLRSESIYFPNARSTSSWTLPATASLFVSRVPSQHGATAWASELGNEHTTLAETLRHAGYRTAGWSSNRLIAEARGFDSGFDTFELVVDPNWKPGTRHQSPYVFAFAEDLIEEALAWLEETSAAMGDDPFFIYLHFMEPHRPYLCPPGRGDACREAAGYLNRRLSEKLWDFDSEEASWIRKFYDSDIRRMDSALDRLYTALEERGFLENTWLILTSDHGEMLGEHGLYTHGNALYEETVRIPLLIRSPNLRSTSSTTPVSLIDIAPTILDVAGIEPPSAFKGRSLRPALEGRPLDPRPIVAELFPLVREERRHYRHVLSVTSGSTKLVLGIDGTLERFDILEDPAEGAAVPAAMSELESYLSQAGVEFQHLEALSKEVPEPSAEAIEDLKALGYIDE